MHSEQIGAKICGGCGNYYAMKSLIFQGQNAIFDTQRSPIFSIADAGS